MASRLHLTEKTAQGTKQGAQSPEVPTQGRESGVLLAFSRFPSAAGRIEQDLKEGGCYIHLTKGAWVVFLIYSTGAGLSIAAEKTARIFFRQEVVFSVKTMYTEDRLFFKKWGILA